MEMIQIDLSALRCPQLLLQAKKTLRMYPDAAMVVFYLSGSAELRDLLRLALAQGWCVSHEHEQALSRWRVQLNRRSSDSQGVVS
ncbi:hypothetical protein C7R88_07420 [Plesiomonas shigelloides]|uniref:sulfurtransferase TusA family protein n=1 Tax=Plesiomonas shigelloides TaxID=703 RepID=UPI000D1366A4|nr:sulfurtransferase TusA family protein [Plesiomonas shigelloides]AVQ87142.1 hypothetical protein C7R88_07420 [Plesiomonas shigelloides]